MAGTVPVTTMLVIAGEVADVGVEMLHADNERPATGRNKTSERHQLSLMRP